MEAIASRLEAIAISLCQKVGGINTSSKNAPSSYLLLVVRPGAPSSVLAPSSDALSS